MLFEPLFMNMLYQWVNASQLSSVDFEDYQYGIHPRERIILIFRSNISQQLPLNETAISSALELHDTLFLRSYEILRQLSIERTSFETFSSWLILMAEDVLAHEDANVEPPPLHTVDTVKVAEYITDRFSTPILAKFKMDMQIDSNSMKVEGQEGYLVLVRRLMEEISGYFKRAAEELREGVSWLLPDWIDLQIHDEIAASDVHITTQVSPNIYRL